MTRGGDVPGLTSTRSTNASRQVLYPQDLSATSRAGLYRGQVDSAPPAAMDLSAVAVLNGADSPGFLVGGGGSETD